MHFGYVSFAQNGLKPKHNLLKIAQTPEDFHGGTIWPVLSGQVPRLEAGSQQKANWSCEFFIFTNDVQVDQRCGHRWLAVGRFPKLSHSRKQKPFELTNRIKIEKLKLFSFTFTARSVGACFSMHQRSNIFHLHKKGGGYAIFFVGTSLDKESLAFREGQTT